MTTTLETSRGYGLKIREEFQSGTLLGVYWNGKLMLGLTTNEHGNRPPVIISEIGGAEPLAVDKLSSDTRESVTAALVSPLITYGVAGNVIGMSFDVMTSNTGRRNWPHFLINQYWGMTCCILSVVTKYWYVVRGTRGVRP